MNHSIRGGLYNAHACVLCMYTILSLSLRIWNAIRWNSKYPIKYLLATAMVCCLMFDALVCVHGFSTNDSVVKYFICNGGNVLLFLTTVLWHTITIRDILPGILNKHSTNKSVTHIHNISIVSCQIGVMNFATIDVVLIQYRLCTDGLREIQFVYFLSFYRKFR